MLACLLARSRACVRPFVRESLTHQIRRKLIVTHKWKTTNFKLGNNMREAIERNQNAEGIVPEGSRVSENESKLFEVEFVEFLRRKIHLV